MAKLPALVTAIAEVDGRDRQSVEHIARVIRERGYIPTGKRGGGAADMTPREAVNLLLALNGADTPKDGPLAIDRFRSLRQFFAGTAAQIRAHHDSFEGQPEAMQAVADCRTFGEALEALIDGVPTLALSFYQYAVKAYPKADTDYWKDHLLGSFRMDMFGVTVTFQRYAATIELFTRSGSQRRVQCEVKFDQDLDRHAAGFYGLAWPDRRVQVEIGMPTLVAAWQALHAGESLPGIPARKPAARDEAGDE